MNTPTLACCCACALALSAAAQAFNVGPNGSQMGDDTRVKLLPEPLKVPQELDMADLPVTSQPSAFYLNLGTSGRYGPYALADGTVVGSKQASYVLSMFDYGMHFTLRPTSNTNAVFGPFAATNGAAVALGNAVMTVVRMPPDVQISVSHPNRISQSPLIGLAPYNNALVRELYTLRAKYATLANRVDTDTADTRLEGVPRISYANGRRSSSPVVRTSERDRQNALKGAERSAMVYLETLFAQAFTIRSQAITDGSTYHFRMPPGDYLLCVTQKIKEPDAGSPAGSGTVVWWTRLRFDGEHPLSLALSAENAINWRDIFKLSRAE